MQALSVLAPRPARAQADVSYREGPTWCELTISRLGTPERAVFGNLGELAAALNYSGAPVDEQLDPVTGAALALDAVNRVGLAEVRRVARLVRRRNARWIAGQAPRRQLREVWSRARERACIDAAHDIFALGERAAGIGVALAAGGAGS